MSKSKKNTVDPETMIKQYGADSVRWFILSDSPPEKDVQWSDTGVVSASKFLQKVWNLNETIIIRKDVKEIEAKEELKFGQTLDLYIYKIDTAINNFQFNVAIAQFYELYRFFNDFINLKISNKILLTGIEKIIKLMIPFTPHLANECLERLDCKETQIWPVINKKIIENIEVKMVIQINGKTRDVININRDLNEEDVDLLVKNNSKSKKYLLEKEIVRTIFVKNKIINYILAK